MFGLGELDGLSPGRRGLQGSRDPIGADFCVCQELTGGWYLLSRTSEICGVKSCEITVVLQRRGCLGMKFMHASLAMSQYNTITKHDRVRFICGQS